MTQAVLCVPTIEVSTSQQGNLLNELVPRFVGINCWCYAFVSYDGADYAGATWHWNYCAVVRTL